MKNIPSLCILLTSLLVSTSATACTGFMSSDNQQVLMGNNEDWLYPEAYLWFYPSQINRYGRMYIKCIYPVQSNPEYLSCFAGINEHGLCYDVFLHPPLKPVNSSHKPTFQGDLMAYCLEKCTTVEEVLVLFDQYNLEFMEDIQYLVVDATGASVIIEGDTIIPKQGTYQVVTNFLQSHPEHGWYPCWRYDTAVRMLENMTEPSVEYFRDICAATHQEGMYPTIYSYVFDITARLIYLYHYYDYDTVVTLNLTEELSLGVHSYSLPEFFEPEDNQPPRTPDRPRGLTLGRIRVPHEYTSSASDPDTNVMYYLFDWGDGTTSNWVKQQDNGEGLASHTWDQRGTYAVKVKAKDIYGQQSNWSDPLSITMPKNLLFEPTFPFLCRVLHLIRALLEQ